MGTIYYVVSVNPSGSRLVWVRL